MRQRSCVALTRSLFGDASHGEACHSASSPDIGGYVTGSQPRSPLSVGLGLASKISTLGFEFALPPLLGYFLDKRLGSAPAGLLVGMILGFTIGIMHILRFARDASRPD